MKFRIQEVKTASEENLFLDVARIINSKEPNWICPLDMEIREIFNPKKNLSFQNGEAIRWIIWESNKLVGRIAAFIKYQKAFGFEQPTGGVGFFECIYNQEAANLLFDTAKKWLADRKMEAMDGPINFGENENFWGLLVEGYNESGYGMTYNPIYYKELFEKYGFKEYYKQFTRRLDIVKPMPERWKKITNYVVNKPNIRFEFVKRKEILKFGKDFLTIYNDAWQFHENFTPITEKQMIVLVNKMKNILIEEMIIFAYVNDEPAGFLLCLPDLNQIFKSWNGKVTFWRGILFLWRKRNQFEWYRKRKILTRGRVTVMGVRPQFQKLGLEAALTLLPFEPVKKLGFTEVELSWQGDFNPKVLNLVDNTDAEVSNVYCTYRYLFDRTKPFVRLNEIALNTKEMYLNKQNNESEKKSNNV